MTDEQNQKEKTKKTEKHFPTEFACWPWVIIVIIVVSHVVCVCLAIYIVSMICNWLPFKGLLCNKILIYSAFFIILILLLWIRYLFHENNENRIRQVDISKVEATFVEADTVGPRLQTNEMKLPEDYEKKKIDLENEVSRLKDLGSNWWTEYQILSLDQMLIDFLKLV